MYVNEQLVGLLKQHLMARDGFADGEEDRPLPAQSDGSQGGGRGSAGRVITRRSPRATKEPSLSQLEKTWPE